MLPRIDDPDGEDAVHALLANLLEQVRTATGSWVFYARDHNHYAGWGRYVPNYYRRHTGLLP
jgi:hypothetical protein